MTALHDAEVAAREVAQLRADLAKAQRRLDLSVEATGRALAAAQRGNAVAQAVIQHRAAMLRWTRDDNPITRGALNIARVAVEDSVQAWLDGQK